MRMEFGCKGPNNIIVEVRKNMLVQVSPAQGVGEYMYLIA